MLATSLQHQSMMDSDKVAKYEEFLNDVLKKDLK